MSQGKKRSRRNRRGFHVTKKLTTGALVAVGVAAVALSATAIYGSQPTVNERAVRMPSAAPEVPDVKPVLTLSRGEGPLRVLIVGDSLTGSLYASTEEAGYQPSMIRALEVGGEVTTKLGHRTGSKTADATGLTELGDNEDLAVIELGTNDYNVTSIPDFIEAYRAIIAAIQSASPNVKVLCVGTWQPLQYGAPYDRIIKSECEAAGGVYRALFDLHANQANRGPAGNAVFGGTSDNFHPNDTGYAKIAERLLGAIVVN